MKKLFTITFIALVLISCKKESRFPIDKPVWSLDDYKSVEQEIIYGTTDGEKYPTFQSDPLVMSKLTDKNSVIKVLDDESLGLEYRKEYSEDLFSLWQNLLEAYTVKDRQDKFVYPVEIVKLRDWGYCIQLRYFKLGNDNIRKKAVNPNDPDVKEVIYKNRQTAISNLTLGISFLTNEDALSDEAKQMYGKMISDNFIQLIDLFPDSNYQETENTIGDILKKLQSDNLKDALIVIKKKIDSVKQNNNSEEKTDVNK